MGLKGNHTNLLEDVELFFTEAIEKGFGGTIFDYYETIDADHGRVEIRRHYTVSEIDWIYGKDDWKNINIIGMVESERYEGDKMSVDRRFYISSLENDAKQFAEAVRSHWGIENSVHWVLDVGFREDESRKRKGNSAFNFSILRHIAMNLLRKEQTMKIGMRTKRLKAGWSDDYLAKVFAAA